MSNNEGPSIRYIPSQDVTVCHGCKYLYSEPFVLGRDFVSKNYMCMHPDSLISYFDREGRNIFWNHKGDCETPDWCPFLKDKK